MHRLRLFLLLALGLCACRTAPPEPSLAPAEPEPPRAAPALEQSVRPGANERFLDPEVDVEHFLGVFEGESREIAVAREAIVDALGIAPGARVADVGAGTGLFLAPLAEAVGPSGRVFAVEISPGFLQHLGERVRQEGLTKVQVVEGGERSSGLPEGSLDLALAVDTYHHFEYPRSMLASLARALRPGGRLVVVDFERIPGVSREWVLGHVRAGKQAVRAEIEQAGFRLEREVPIEELEENYMLVFRRP